MSFKEPNSKCMNCCLLYMQKKPLQSSATHNKGL
uniref:Uncharacterized protein n=1 Tax=Anguilla anguilla TaxID=7936 RepID=A0A0E9S242_ANGAN